MVLTITIIIIIITNAVIFRSAPLLALARLLKEHIPFGLGFDLPLLQWSQDAAASARKQWLLLTKNRDDSLGCSGTVNIWRPPGFLLVHALICALPVSGFLFLRCMELWLGHVQTAPAFGIGSFLFRWSHGRRYTKVVGRGWG
jgi:hypothetical protein